MSNGSARCPATGCEFADAPSLVAAHVNGTDDDAHDWATLPYDGPGEFLSAARSGGATGRDGPSGVVESPESAPNGQGSTDDGPDASGSGTGSTDGSEADTEADTEAEPDHVRCPVEDCSYTGPPKSVAAHVSGKRDPAHDMGSMPYPNAASFPPAHDDDATDANSDPDHPFDPADAFGAVEVAREAASGVEDLAELDTAELADLFVAFSVLAGEARSVRGDVRNAILDRVAEDGEIEGELGAVDRSTKTRRRLREEDEVRRALFRAGVDPRDAETFDPDLVAEVAEDADVEEEAVFDLAESEHVRRAAVNEDAFEGQREE